MPTAAQGKGRHGVSVVLASYNQPNALRLSLAGFAAQDDLDFEMIVADEPPKGPSLPPEADRGQLSRRADSHEPPEACAWLSHRPWQVDRCPGRRAG